MILIYIIIYFINKFKPKYLIYFFFLLYDVFLNNTFKFVDLIYHYFAYRTLRMHTYALKNYSTRVHSLTPVPMDNILDENISNFLYKI